MRRCIAKCQIDLSALSAAGAVLCGDLEYFGQARRSRLALSSSNQ
jgi:hypothetical protein